MTASRSQNNAPASILLDVPLAFGTRLCGAVNDVLAGPQLQGPSTKRF
jgi:hypothetical protein